MEQQIVTTALIHLAWRARGIFCYPTQLRQPHTVTQLHPSQVFPACFEYDLTFQGYEMPYWGKAMGLIYWPPEAVWRDSEVLI